MDNLLLWSLIDSNGAWCLTSSIYNSSAVAQLLLSPLYHLCEGGHGISKQLFHKHQHKNSFTADSSAEDLFELHWHALSVISNHYSTCGAG